MSSSINITEVVADLRRKWRKELSDSEQMAAYYRGLLDGADILISKISVPETDKDGTQGSEPTRISK